MFIGYTKDPIKVSAVGMGNIMLNILVVAPLTGLNSSLETLLSSAFGAQNIQLCGVYLQRGRVVCICAYFAILPVILVTLMILDKYDQ